MEADWLGGWLNGLLSVTFINVWLHTTCWGSKVQEWSGVLGLESVRMLQATAAPTVWLMREDSRQTVLPLPSTSNQNTARANAYRTQRIKITSVSPCSTQERTGQRKAGDQRLHTVYCFLRNQRPSRNQNGKYLYSYVAEVTRCDALIQGLHQYS